MAIKEQLLDSLKKAMKGEMDSVTLYNSAAEHSPDPEVKAFFHQRKEEERQHYNYLLQYYQEISNDLQPSDLLNSIDAKLGNNPIFSADFMRRIGADQILFSAISTALLLEKDSIEHYRNAMNATENLTLKSFFDLMVKWESKHYDDLLVIQKDAEVYYWQINQFEPF